MAKIDGKAKKTATSTTGGRQSAPVQSEARRLGRRLTLKFAGEDKPELDRIEFRFKESTAPVFWQRGDIDHSFVWTEVPQALAILFLDYRCWEPQSLSAPFFFCGAKNGSLAASLGDAIQQPKSRIHNLFIESFPSGGSNSCVRHVFCGDNLHGKAKRDRRVSVNANFLPSDCLEFFWDERGLLLKPGDIRLLADLIRGSLGLNPATDARRTEANNGENEDRDLGDPNGEVGHHNPHATLLGRYEGKCKDKSSNPPIESNVVLVLKELQEKVVFGEIIFPRGGLAKEFAFAGTLDGDRINFTTIDKVRSVQIIWSGILFANTISGNYKFEHIFFPSVARGILNLFLLPYYISEGCYEPQGGEWRCVRA